VSWLSRDRLPSRDTALVTGAVALGLSFTPSLVARRRGDQAKVSIAAAVLGAGAGTAGEIAVMRLAERLEGGEPAARGVLAAGALLAAGLRLPAHGSSGVALAGTGAIVAGTAAVLGAVAPVRRWDGLHDPRVAALAAAAALGAAYGARTLQRRPPRVRLEDWPEGYLGHDVGRGRLAAAARVARLRGPPLPRHGAARRPDRRSARRRPGPGSDPGLRRRALGPDDRGALRPRGGRARAPRRVPPRADRRLLRHPARVREPGPAAGRGAVRPRRRGRRLRPVLRPADPVHAAQGPGRRPDPPRPADRLAARVPADGPEIVVYGESLGAWASQNVFRREGVRALDALRVGRALWAGTPRFSRLPALIEAGKVPADDRVGVLGTRELLDADPRDAARLRFVFLQRRLDPVVAFSGLELIWRRPAWLPDRRWIPGITFLQMVADLLRATRWTSDVPRAAAHDYRVELPLAVNVALGHHVDRAEAVRLADALIELEVERGSMLKALRRPRSG
jgi:hypothetical protein